MLKLKIVKNKFAPPFKTVEFPIIFGKGISKLDILLDLAVAKEIIAKSGSFFKYDGVNIGQGAEKAKAYLIENIKVHDEVMTKVKALLTNEEFDSPARDVEDDDEEPNFDE